MILSPSRLTLCTRFANGAFQPPIGLAVGGGGLVEEPLALVGEKVLPVGELPQAGRLPAPGVIAGKARLPGFTFGRHQNANMMSSSSAP